MRKILLSIAMLFASCIYTFAQAQDTLWTKYTYPTQINCVKFSPDGQFLYSGGSDGVPRKWNAMTGEQLDTFPSLQKPITNISISDKFISFTNNLVSNIYYLTNDSLYGTLTGAIYKFTNDNNFAIGGSLSGLSIFNINSLQLIKSINIGELYALDLSSDNKIICVSVLGDTSTALRAYSYPELNYAPIPFITVKGNLIY